MADSAFSQVFSPKKESLLISSKKSPPGALASISPNIGKGEDGGGMGQGHGLAAQTLVIHDAPPRN